MTTITRDQLHEMLKAEEQSGKEYFEWVEKMNGEDGLLYGIWEDTRTGKRYAARETRTVHMGFNSNESGTVEKLVAIVEREGDCLASWGVTGRTMHMILAEQLAKELPQYEFEIGYNYHCLVRKK